MTEYLTPQEVADELRVTKRSVYEWLRTGRLEASRAGNRWRISRSELARFLAQRRKGAAGWACEKCGGKLHPTRVCWSFAGERREVWLECEANREHTTIHEITAEQYERARAGDYAWLRGR